MRTVQDIAFDVTGQKVYFDCPEGRPSAVTSATVYLWDSSDTGTGESAIGSASVETDPNTTTDAAAGSGQTDRTLIPVTATTGMAADRQYLITDASGLREWFDVASFASGVSVTAKHPLHNAYASGATVQSTRIQATIDSTWVADEGNLSDGPNPGYRIRWEYVVGGVTYVADSYFNLVRYVGAHGVRPQDVEATNPGWIDRLPTDHQSDQGRRLINEAYRAVKLDLHAIDMDDAAVAESEIVDELTRYKAVALGEWSRVLAGGGSETAYDIARKAYQERLDSLIRIATKVPVRESSGAAQPAVSLGLTRR